MSDLVTYSPPRTRKTVFSSSASAVVEQGGCAPLGVSLIGKRDPPQLPSIFGERYCIGVDVCGPAQVPPRGRHNEGGWRARSISASKWVLRVTWWTADVH